VTVSLAEAAQQFLEAKGRANCRPAYIRSLKQYISQFIAGREQSPVSRIALQDLELWFASRNESPSSCSSNIGRLSSFFEFARRRNWVHCNPCKSIEKPRIDRPAPRILTVAESEDLMRLVAKRHQQFLVYFTLGLFCGIRPAELMRLDWSAIDLTARTVRVDGAASKTRRRRIVDIPEKALEWLNAALFHGGPIVSSLMTLRRARRRICAVVGHLPQDILRHTWTSYHVALHQDIGRTAHQAGNSERIVRQHYLQLANRQDAARFFAIAP
jgi:integrase